MQITEVKTFLDLLKYIFQKRVWACIDTIPVYWNAKDDVAPMYYMYILKDQFGNIKKIKI